MDLFFKIGITVALTMAGYFFRYLWENIYETPE
jgi:hypothetical protein